MAQVCMRNGVAFAALKSVSDRLFSKAQQEEYFNFPEAMKKLNAVVLPLGAAAAGGDGVMKDIASFQVDHTILSPGLYFSRADGPGPYL